MQAPGGRGERRGPPLRLRLPGITFPGLFDSSTATLFTIGEHTLLLNLRQPLLSPTLDHPVQTSCVVWDCSVVTALLATTLYAGLSVGIALLSPAGAGQVP